MNYLQFFFGVIAMQVVYLIYHIILFRRAAFLYYLFFVLLMSLFVGLVFNFGLKETSSSMPAIQRFSYGYSSLFLGNALYYKFIREICEAATKYPRFNKNVKWIEWSIIFTALLLAGDTLINGAPGFSKSIGRIMYVINIFFQFYLIYFLLRTKVLMNILIVAGGFIMSIFVKMVLVPVAIDDMDLSAMEISSFVMLGIIIDFLILTFLLVYQSRLWEIRTADSLLRKNEELTQQRNEISNDLHDDIGASLSSLHVYSTVALNSISEPENVKLYLEKIRTGVRSVMERMNDVIWAVKTENESKTPLSSKLKNYFVEVLDASQISIHYDFEEGVEELLKGIVTRKNLLLIGKEAVNNIVKHSGARNINLKLHRNSELIIFEIADDGRGIRDFEMERGNGIGNMRYRVKQIAGSFRIKNQIESSGAHIVISIPIESAKSI